jgi:hypothetical protein
MSLHPQGSLSCAVPYAAGAQAVKFSFWRISELTTPLIEDAGRDLLAPSFSHFDPLQT